jgi:hypothetical protein
MKDIGADDDIIVDDIPTIENIEVDEIDNDSNSELMSE